MVRDRYQKKIEMMLTKIKKESVVSTFGQQKLTMKRKKNRGWGEQQGRFFENRGNNFILAAAGVLNFWQENENKTATKFPPKFRFFWSLLSPNPCINRGCFFIFKKPFFLFNLPSSNWPRIQVCRQASTQTEKDRLFFFLL
jgi:hypothetical protein